MRPHLDRIYDHDACVGSEHTDPTARTLSLLSLLQTGRPWTVTDLAVRLAVSGRTMRRDLGRLRGLGYQVRTRPGPGGAVRLLASSAVPPLLFDDDEVLAVVAGLRLAGERLGADDAAGRAHAKLERLLPPRLAVRAAAAAAVTEVVPGVTPAVDLRTFGLLADAAAEQGRVSFAYRRRSGSESFRVVDPVRLVVRRGQWYLLAVDVDRDDWRTFRLDRVRDTERVPGTYARRDLPAASVQAYLHSDFARPGTRVSLVFATSAQRLADLLPDMDGELVPLDHSSCRYVTQVSSPLWFAATTAVLGVPFEVVEPTALADACRDLAAVLGGAGQVQTERRWASNE